ncbi:MAG: XRE family transcriptional regulator [Oscillospiraceae bacterium]|nr:XRE family transcriptional regulator [Oscillospiraceae bacterium]
MEIHDMIKLLRVKKGMSQEQLAAKTGYRDRSSIAKIESGKVDLSQSKIALFAAALHTTPAHLMGWEDTPTESIPFPAPRITEDVVTFPVIGEVAAGYEHIAVEDWDGDTIDIPAQYLRGHNVSEFFVLTVNGESMYPLFVPGDKVLVLKQSTLNKSGDIGVIRYDGDAATLKKVEYVTGEDWMRLVPLNPNYPPRTIEGADLEACSVLGVPRLVLRELGE